LIFYLLKADVFDVAYCQLITDELTEFEAPRHVVRLVSEVAYVYGIRYSRVGQSDRFVASRVTVHRMSS
jgi:hypothetical protein